jgi:hypothetical protein
MGPLRTAWWQACVAVAGLLAGSRPAVAHPFDDGLAGHRLKLTISEDYVQADYLVEEPVPWVLRDLRAFLAGVPQPGAQDQERYTQRRLEEFEGGLQLYVDGERTEWGRLPWAGDNGVGDRQFVVYGLTLRAPLDASSPDQALHLLDVNHSDVRVARMVEVWGDATVDLRGCSLWTDPEGGPGEDYSGDWVVGDRFAELRLTRRLQGPLSAGWARLGASMRKETMPQKVGPAGIAGPTPPWKAAGAMLAIVGLIGVAVARRLRGGRG